MRAWICALVMGLCVGCSGGGNQSDGGGGGGTAGGAGGQAGGAAGQAGGAAGAAGQAGGSGSSGGGGRGGSAGAAGGGGRGGSAGAAGVGGRGGGAAGAGGQAGTTAAGGRGGASDGGTDACATLPGSTFLSVDLLECGRGVDGGVRCNWRIMFGTSGTTFTWQYSDVGETGNYSCIGNAITTRSQRNVTGSYDPGTMRLTWDGVLYARQ